jgi:hypothetical protein
MHKATSVPATPPKSRAEATKPLMAAIYPRCGTETFARPAVTPITRTRPPKGWQVVFLYPPRAPKRPHPGQTTNITILETPPLGRPPKVPGAQEITVAGRRVSLRNRANKSFYAARWLTGKARYTALADGDTPAALKRIIACLP